MRSKFAATPGAEIWIDERTVPRANTDAVTSLKPVTNDVKKECVFPEMSRHIRFSVDQHLSARNTDPEIAFINENSDVKRRKAGTKETEITSKYPA